MKEEETKMNYVINASLAHMLGFNCAMVLQLICEDIVGKSDNGEEPDICGDYWCRVSHKMLSAKLPILTEDTARRALENLVAFGILKKKELNKSRFDRTASYTLTEYGLEVMVSAHA